MSIVSFLEQYASFLGLYVAGDIADYTFYTTKRGNVVGYPKSPPCKPPTDAQLRQRKRFQMAQRNWHFESAATQAAWELMVHRCNLDMTGQNAYISLSLVPESDKLATLNRKAKTSLAMPTYIGY
jgi:hypothetical protein